jgi:hypothetical protein
MYLDFKLYKLYELYKLKYHGTKHTGNIHPVIAAEK